MKPIRIKSWEEYIIFKEFADEKLWIPGGKGYTQHDVYVKSRIDDEYLYILPYLSTENNATKWKVGNNRTEFIDISYLLLKKPPSCEYDALKRIK